MTTMNIFYSQLYRFHSFLSRRVASSPARPEKREQYAIALNAPLSGSSDRDREMLDKTAADAQTIFEKLLADGTIKSDRD